EIARVVRRGILRAGACGAALDVGRAEPRPADRRRRRHIVGCTEVTVRARQRHDVAAGGTGRVGGALRASVRRIAHAHTDATRPGTEEEAMVAEALAVRSAERAAPGGARGVRRHAARRPGRSRGVRYHVTRLAGGALGVVAALLDAGQDVRG